MTNRIAHQATAFSLAAIFTITILGSINTLAVQPAEHGVLAAERAASQVAGSVQADARQQAGG